MGRIHPILIGWWGRFANSQPSFSHQVDLLRTYLYPLNAWVLLTLWSKNDHEVQNHLHLLLRFFFACLYGSVRFIQSDTLDWRSDVYRHTHTLCERSGMDDSLLVFYRQSRTLYVVSSTIFHHTCTVDESIWHKCLGMPFAECRDNPVH